MKVIGEGFQFPEGPIAFPDGSVVFVELLRGTLTRVWGDGRSEVVCDLGGGPNGAALGPDGAVYVCNCGGYDTERGPNGELAVIGPKPAERGGGGRIERVDLATGRSERLYDSSGGNPLSAPNDLVLDADGGIWFTDLGLERPRSTDKSGLYYARPDGSSIAEVDYGPFSYNGVGLSPDGATIYVADTRSARLWAYDIEGPGRVGPRRLVGTAPGGVMLDSLAVVASGAICVGTLDPGGVTTFRPDGTTRLLAVPDGTTRLLAVPGDPWVTNICFGGPGLRTAYLTLSLTGRVVAMDWPEPGLRLNFGAV